MDPRSDDVAPPAPRRKRAQTKSPAFQFYPSDFLGSTKVRAMNAEQIGVYTLLLCLDWQESGFTLEEAEEHVAFHGQTAAKFRANWTKVSRCFAEREGRYFNSRLDEERAKQKEWRRKSSKGGKIAADRKRNGGSTTLAPPLDNGSSGRQYTPSLSPSPTPKTTTPPIDALFEEAWADYPKRAGNSKADTRKQWLARVREGVDPLDMVGGGRRYRAFVEAEGTEPRFIKQAQTFFGRGRHFESDWTPSRPADSLEARVAALREEDEAGLARGLKLVQAKVSA